MSELEIGNGTNAPDVTAAADLTAAQPEAQPVPPVPQPAVATRGTPGKAPKKEAKKKNKPDAERLTKLAGEEAVK